MKKIFFILFLMLTNLNLLFCTDYENNLSTKMKILALNNAIGDEDTKKIESMLSSGEIDINFRLSFDMTFLMSACSKNKILSVETLLKYKPNVNLKDNDGWTALTFAVVKEHKEIVELLLDAEADVNIKDKEELTVLNRAYTNNNIAIMLLLLPRYENNNNLYETILLDWSSKGYTEQVKDLLHLVAIDVNFKSPKDVTSLMAAACNGHTKIVELLIEFHANPDIKNSKGKTALTLAREKGHKEIIEILSKYDTDRSHCSNCTIL